MTTPRRKLPKINPAMAIAGGIGMGGLAPVRPSRSLGRVKDAAFQPVERKYVDVSDNPQWLALEPQMDRARKAVERWEDKEVDANTAMREIAGDQDVEGLRFRLFHSHPQGPVNLELVAAHFGVSIGFLDRFRDPRRHSVTIQRIVGRRRKR